MASVVYLQAARQPRSGRGIVAVREHLQGLGPAVAAAYRAAFPPERTALGAWLVTFGAAALEPRDPSSQPPTAKAAALRQGALLYEVSGEPVAGRRR